MNNITRKIIALQEARDRAQDPDFKLIWESKLQELIKKAERGGSQSESIQW